MKIDPKHTFLTSDHHFGSYKLPRPFCVFSKEDEKILIEKWNDTIDTDDLVIYVGDFCDCNLTEMIEYRKQLNGRFLFIKGNHDSFPKNIYEAVFQSFKTKITIPQYNLDIAHVPREKMSDRICIYGHLHRGHAFKPLLPNHKICTCASKNDGYPLKLSDILDKVSVNN